MYSDTGETHFGGERGALQGNMDLAITYYTPLNPSLDNNTVEMGVEQARFGTSGG